MDPKCNSADKKNKVKNGPAANSDQLGENASEEYRSERYANAKEDGKSK